MERPAPSGTSSPRERSGSSRRKTPDRPIPGRLVSASGSAPASGTDAELDSPTPPAAVHSQSHASPAPPRHWHRPPRSRVRAKPGLRRRRLRWLKQPNPPGREGRRRGQRARERTAAPGVARHLRRDPARRSRAHPGSRRHPHRPRSEPLHQRGSPLLRPRPHVPPLPLRHAAAAQDRHLHPLPRHRGR